MTQLTPDADPRKFDGKGRFAADDEIEEAMDRHFDRFDISPNEVSRNFAIYSRRFFLKRFLAHYELFRRTRNLPGDIIELGVYRGTSLMSWANFLEIFNMGDRQKQVFGFDNFKGFPELDQKDGREDPKTNKIPGGFDSSPFLDILKEAIGIFDSDRFIPHKPRVILVEGDITETLPEFIETRPGLRLSLIHIDCDIYQPSKIGLELLWPRLVPGGVLVLDDYSIRPWEGESAAVDEYFGSSVKIHRFDWAQSPGGYIIKGE